jgi:hypothetical protein
MQRCKARPHTGVGVLLTLGSLLKPGNKTGEVVVNGRQQPLLCPPTPHPPHTHAHNCPSQLRVLPLLLSCT